MMIQQQGKNEDVLKEEQGTYGDVLMNNPANNGDALNRFMKTCIGESSMIQCKKQDHRMSSYPEDLNVPKNIPDHSPKGQGRDFMDSTLEMSDECENKTYRKMIDVDKKYQVLRNMDLQEELKKHILPDEGTFSLPNL